MQEKIKIEILEKPTVSVCMVTYNHEKYIAQAIEGVMTQETNFKIELVIGEDSSTDRTRKICLEYKNKFPHIIKLRLQEKNLGMMKNFYDSLSSCTGDYIAICEGDDYWTDPYKLQKQIDFLEENPEYGLCYGNTLLNYNDKKICKFNRQNYVVKNIERFGFPKVLFKLNPIRTCTVVFRRPLFEDYKKNTIVPYKNRRKK